MARTQSSNPAARRARERRAAAKAAAEPNVAPAPATQAAVNAQQKEAARARSKQRPLAEVVAEANEKGYLGQDGADLGVQVRVSGVAGPGGHPEDATSKASVGAAARK